MTPSKNKTPKINIKSLKKWFSRNLPQIGITLGVAAVLSSVFYFGVMKPRLKVPSKLLEIQNYSATNYSNLLQTRLSIMAFMELDHKSKSFNDARQTALENLDKFNEEGTKYLKKTNTPEPFDSNVEELVTLNETVITKLPNLEIDATDLLRTQKDIYTDVAEFDGIVNNIYLYDARFDLSVEGMENLGERVARAQQGLEKINTNLKKSKFAEDTTDIQNQIEETRGLMTILGTKILERSVEGDELNGSLTEIYYSLEVLKTITLDYHQGMFKTEKAIKMITDLTNVMMKYESFTEKVRQTKMALYNEGDKIF